MAKTIHFSGPNFPALPPNSAVGILLHALVGYDARPSAAQLACYLGVLALIYVGIVPLFGAALYVFALGDIKRLEVATQS